MFYDPADFADEFEETVLGADDFILSKKEQMKRNKLAKKNQRSSDQSKSLRKKGGLASSKHSKW